MYDLGLDSSLCSTIVVSSVVALAITGLMMKTNGTRQKKLKTLAEEVVTSVRAENQSVLDEKPDQDIEKDLYTAAETRNLIDSQKLNPSDNVLKLAKRCRKYGRDTSKVNAITHELYDQAYKTVKGLDFKTKTKSPLFGIPISIKESSTMQGTFATCGLACRLQKRIQKDSLIVKTIRQTGAIPMCLGNVPQLLMSMETSNRVWGTTKNPWDLSRTPGGSTGGDAALVAMRCVPLALGSDVAGSLRIPAAFCGIVGFKTSDKRLTNKGQVRQKKNNRNGLVVVIPPTAGGLAGTVEDCAMFIKSLLVQDMFKADTSITPLPFNDMAYEAKGKLKIGYYITDHFLDPCAAAKRGVRETITALEKAGHECVQIELPFDGWVAQRLLLGLNAAEGNMRSFIEGLEGEEICDQYKFLYKIANLPNPIRFLAKKVIDERRSWLLACTRSGGISAATLWEFTQDLLTYRDKWNDYVVENGFDAIISPAMPIPAVPHGLSEKLTSTAGYMFVANLLLWPCGAVPVTVVKEDEEHYRPGDLPANQRDAFMKEIQKVMKQSAGMPLGVNVMTPKHQDEKCLRVMKEVERVVGFNYEPTAYKA
mmetsp:Transcript_29057/g.41095  ORF Transcript_29057/g.41095 Transcript_29057/m.41095 type:complete len:593 (+) Transcript_29057:239-2017(+)